MAKQRYRPLRSFTKHKVNPFLSQGVEEIKNGITTKKKLVGEESGKNTQLIINNDTGAVEGHAQFVKYMKVDEDKFTKIYTSQLKVLYNLNTPAIRVFTYILDNLKPNSDKIIFYIKKCQEFTGYASENTIHKGLSKLIEAGIIAKTQFAYLYFINVRLFFNGNRISMVEEYFKEEKQKEKAFSEGEEEIKKAEKARQGRTALENFFSNMERIVYLTEKEVLTDDEKEELEYARSILNQLEGGYKMLQDNVSKALEKD